MLNQISRTIRINAPKHPSLWLPLLFVAFTGGVLVLLVFAMLVYQLIFLQRAYPGVSVAGLDVGGMTRPEIMSAINTLGHERLSRPLTIRVDNSEQWTFTGQQLGMQVDVVATADLAFAVGRQGNLLADMLTHLSLYSRSVNVEPLFRYDDGPTTAILQQLSQVVDYPPQNARLQIGSDGSVEVTLAQRGRRLHIDATRPLIEAAILGDGPQVIDAFTQQVLPAIDTADVAPVQQQARLLLSQPLVLQVEGGGAWQILPADLAPMITIAENNDDSGKPVVSLQLAPEKLMPYFEQIISGTNTLPHDASLYFNEESNQLEVTEPSRNGRELDVAAAQQAVTAAVSQGAHTVNLPVRTIPPQISSDNLDSLGITANVAEATSYFKGSSAGRMHNIEVATSKFNGVLVPPGEIFSFNDNLGEVTKEQGYDESLIIFGNRTTLDVGGGVCQVSTTAFRAALFGGFELVERWAHAYRVSWYETNSAPGLDATIYTPDVDFRFRNDTDHYLLIQTETDLDEGTVTFKFFGTPTNRKVEVSEPLIENKVAPAPPAYEEVPNLPAGTIKQVDWAIEGMDVTITRVVKIDDRVLHEDKIVSRYQPWRAVYQVGAGTRIPGPAPRN